MQPDNRTVRTELLEREKELQRDRDFEGLLNVYDKPFNLAGAGSGSMVMFKKIYCLIRLGKLEDSLVVWRGWNWVLVPGMDEEIAREMMEVVAFFHGNETRQEVFGLKEIQMVNYWVKDSKISKEVKEMVFDYEDIIRGWPD